MDKYTITEHAADFTSKVTYTPSPMASNPWFGLAIIGIFVALIIIATCWPSIVEWFNGVRYRNHSIKSLVICQKTPNIDLKKLYQIVDDTNNFLRGKDMKGIKIARKKIHTKNLISVTSTQGNGCHYFVVWYKG